MLDPKTNGTTDGPRDASAPTRDAVFASAWRCMQQALAMQLRDDAASRDLFASDALFRELHDCITTYTVVLRGLGDDEGAVVAVMLRTLDEASTPGEPHPALRDAVDEWTRQAFRGD